MRLPGMSLRLPPLPRIPAKTGEGPLIEQFIAALTLRQHFVWRQNTGAMKIPDTSRRKGFRFLKFGKPGISDILGVARDGRMLAVEVKYGTTATTAAQLEFIAEIQRRGGRAGIARTLEEALEIAESPSAKKIRKSCRNCAFWCYNKGDGFLAADNDFPLRQDFPTGNGNERITPALSRRKNDDHHHEQDGPARTRRGGRVMFSATTYNAIRCFDAMIAAAGECPDAAELGYSMERAAGMISNGNICPGFSRARKILRDTAAENGHSVPRPQIWELMTRLGEPEAIRFCKLAKNKLGAKPDAPRRGPGWGNR